MALKPMILANCKAKKAVCGNRTSRTHRDCRGVEAFAGGADEDEDGDYLRDERVSSLP